MLHTNRLVNKTWIKRHFKNIVNAFLKDIAGHENAEEAFRKNKEREDFLSALKEKDRAIRQAYVDVISAVTGGRLVFVTREELDLMLGKPISGTHAVTSNRELAEARQILRCIIRESFPGLDPDGFMVAFGEALTNAVKYAGSGNFQVFKLKKTLQIVISDSGPGIDFKTLPKATLMNGFSTRKSMGVGFTIMLDIAERVLLSTQPGNTTVVLEIITSHS